MRKPVLLVGDAPDREVLVQKMPPLGLEAVCLAGTPAADALLAAARENGAQGVLALNETVRAAVREVARTLNLPGEDTAPDFAEWDQLAAGGTAAAEHRLVRDEAEARAAAETLGTPVWVRPAALRAAPFCMRVDDAEDASLAFAKVHGRNAQAPVLVQRPVAGAACRLVGFKLRRDFFAIETISERMGDSPYRVPEKLVLPWDIPDKHYQQAVDVAHKVARRLPSGWYPLELGFVATDDGPVLVHMHTPVRFEPALAAILYHAEAVDLDADLLRVAAGEQPTETPRRFLGACAAWLPVRTGIVKSVHGRDEAAGLPGVQAVHVAANVGDHIGHTVDRATRDTSGYVIATGGRRADALRNAEAAIAKIAIETRPTA